MAANALDASDLAVGSAFGALALSPPPCVAGDGDQPTRPGFGPQQYPAGSKHDRTRPFDGDKPEVGDHVIFERYAGKEIIGQDG